jgi:methyl-accepting chemotaxis protein
MSSAQNLKLPVDDADPPLDLRGVICAVNTGNPTSTKPSWAYSSRPVAGALATGALGLLLYHLTGNWPTAGAALLVGGCLVALLEQRASATRARHQAAFQNTLLAVASGNWSARLDHDATGEFGELGEFFNQFLDGTQKLYEKVDDLASTLIEIPGGIAGAMSELSKGVDDQEASVEETSSLLANINTSIRGINTEIVNLASSNEETASSIMEMGSAIEQVATSANALSGTVESSTSAVHELNAQIRRVSESGSAVQEVAEETAASITQMDHAIREVGDHVRSASELTEQVSQSAEEGTQAVGATIDGIAQIRSLTQDAKTALEGLADRIGAIGEIASVINGISDETNLLSLNAAIIAAQAGEHGKAFAVVAEQVKTLARRTTVSTKEIESLIESIQEQSENAVRAMRAGIDAVEQGVKRSMGAGEALDRIRRNARDASGRVSEISRAAEEQARNSRHVSESAQTTSAQVQQISAALAEQSQATERILTNATQSLEMCRQMTSATEEQRSSSRYISTNISSITELIASIQSKTASHEQASNGVAESVASMLGTARKSSERLPEVARSIIAMKECSEQIRSKVRAGLREKSGP